MARRARLPSLALLPPLPCALHDLSCSLVADLLERRKRVRSEKRKARRKEIKAVANALPDLDGRVAKADQLARELAGNAEIEWARAARSRTRGLASRKEWASEALPDHAQSCTCDGPLRPGRGDRCTGMCAHFAYKWAHARATEKQAEEIKSAWAEAVRADSMWRSGCAARDNAASLRAQGALPSTGRLLAPTADIEHAKKVLANGAKRQKTYRHELGERTTTATDPTRPAAAAFPIWELAVGARAAGLRGVIVDSVACEGQFSDV